MLRSVSVVNGERRRRGNALVEFSLTWVPIMVLLFGLADVSRMLFMRNMVENAVRDAVRSASTYQFDLDNSHCESQTECIKRVVRKGSLGLFNGTAGGREALDYIHVSYYSPDNLAVPLTQAQLPKSVNGVEVRYVNQPGNLVEVRVDNYPFQWLIPVPAGYLSGTGLTFSVASSDVLQALPTAQYRPPAP